MSGLKAHYSIDFTSGFCMGILCSMLAEWLSYFIDVLFCGKPASKRDKIRYRLCPSCGWACSQEPLDLIDREERHIQAYLHDRQAYREAFMM